jgi:hypothetical protein
MRRDAGRREHWVDIVGVIVEVIGAADSAEAGIKATAVAPTVTITMTDTRTETVETAAMEVAEAPILPSIEVAGTVVEAAAQPRKAGHDRDPRVGTKVAIDTPAPSLAVETMTTTVERKVRRIQQTVAGREAVTETERNTGTARTAITTTTAQKTAGKRAVSQSVTSRIEGTKEIGQRRIDPIKIDPIKIDPIKIDPTKIDPTKIDPKKIDRIGTDPIEIASRTRKTLAKTKIGKRTRTAGPKNPIGTKKRTENETETETETAGEKRRRSAIEATEETKKRLHHPTASPASPVVYSHRWATRAVTAPETSCKA